MIEVICSHQAVSLMVLKGRGQEAEEIGQFAELFGFGTIWGRKRQQ